MNDISLYTCKEDEKLEELYLTIYEWKVIREIVKLLNLFKKVTCLLSDIKYLTIGFTYPSIYNLKERLKIDFDLLETNKAKEYRNAILNDMIVK